MAYFNLDIKPIQERCAERGDIKHVRFPIRDFDPYDLRRKLPRAVSRLVREHRADGKGTLYIHCTAGEEEEGGTVLLGGKEGSGALGARSASIASPVRRAGTKGKGSEGERRADGKGMLCIHCTAGEEDGRKGKGQGGECRAYGKANEPLARRSRHSAAGQARTQAERRG